MLLTLTCPLTLHPPDCSKVHFPAEQAQKDTSEIVLEKEGENRIGVHLGFLQIRHHYEVRFSIKDGLYEDLEADPLQNLHCKVLQLMPSEDGKWIS